MKEANYNHLKLDNFPSFRSDFGSNSRKKKTRTKDYMFNKENFCPSNALNSDTPTSAAVLGSNNQPGRSTCRMRDLTRSKCNLNNFTPPTVAEKSHRLPLSNISNTFSFGSGIKTDELNGKTICGKERGLEAEARSVCKTTRSSNVSNITSDPCAQSCLTEQFHPRKSQKNWSSTVLAESATRLFEETNVDVEYDVKDKSTKSGLLSVDDSDDDDLFWDDDSIYGDNEDDTTLNDMPEICTTVPDGYATLGAPTECCSKCHAIMWKEERANKNVKHGVPKFSICCGQGQIKLPETPPTPSYLMQLYNDRKKSNHFKRCIRLYNAMFAFTSIGGKVDHTINCGRAPYIYRLNGQNHHVFGTLIPNEGDDPVYYQLYIYDTEHEVENRMKWVKVDDGEAIDTEIVEGLIRMLDETNQLVRKFRYARDRFEEQPIRNLRIKMKVCRSESGRENNIGPSDEVAAVLVGDDETTIGIRDIIIEKTNKDLERISTIHPSLMALQYPLLFPMGEDGYHEEIPYVDPENQKKKNEKE